MQQVIVTKKENIQQDEDGNFVEDGDGNLILLDPEAIGVLNKTHMLAVSQVVKDQIQTGFVSRSEVFWEHLRSPAPAMEDPSDLAWISYAEDSLDEEVDDDGEEYEDDDNVIEVDQ